MSAMVSAEVITNSVVPIHAPNVHRLPTPMELLTNALSTGAGVDVIERLMALHTQWEAREARKAFAAAISAAKAEIPPILKTSKVDYKPKDSGPVSYSHEDLGEMCQIIDPILGKHGLSYRYKSSQNGSIISMACIVEHCNGHNEETSLAAPADTSGKKNAIQSIGSTITYLQRYTLKLALGIAASKDTDANSCDERQEPDRGRNRQNSNHQEPHQPAEPCTQIKWTDNSNPVSIIDRNLYNVVSAEANKAFAANDPQWVLDLRDRNADALRAWCKSMGKEARDMLIDLFARAEAAVAEKGNQQPEQQQAAAS
jgi:hypothetical protein